MSWSDNKVRTLSIALLFAVITAFFFLRRCDRDGTENEPYFPPEPVNVDALLEEMGCDVEMLYADSVSNTMTLLEHAFQPCAGWSYEEFRFVFQQEEVGMLKIETGRICELSAENLNRMIPYDERFPIGEFPVQVAKAAGPFGEPIAYSRVLFSDAKVVSWMPAMYAADSIPFQLGDEYSPLCLPHDAGIALYIDSLSADDFNAGGDQLWQEVFVDGANEIVRDGLDYQFNGHRFSAFGSGYGDGCYPSFIGYDADDNICVLLTDYYVIPYF